MVVLRLRGRKYFDGLVMSALGLEAGMAAWVELPCGRPGEERDLGGDGGS